MEQINRYDLISNKVFTRKYSTVKQSSQMQFVQTYLYYVKEMCCQVVGDVR